MPKECARDARRGVRPRDGREAALRREARGARRPVVWAAALYCAWTIFACPLPAGEGIGTWSPSGLFGGARLEPISALAGGTVRSLLGPESGGSLSGLLAYQIAFSHPRDGNVVFLVWKEPEPNPPALDVFEDGVFLGQVDSRPENGAVISWVKVGRHSYKVRGTEELSVELDVLAREPFEGASDLEWSVREEADGCGCNLTVSWRSTDPPDEWLVTIDAERLLRVPGRERSVSIDGLCSGHRRVEVRGFADETYLGDPSVLCASIAEGCARGESTCPPIRDLEILQDAYGADGSRLRLRWERGAVYDQIEVQVGDQSFVVPGWWDGLIVTQLAARRWDFSVRGACCGAPGPVTQGSFEVLEETPLPEPFASVLCHREAGSEDLAISWRSLGEWSLILVHVVSAQGRWSVAAGLPGDATSWVLQDAAAGSRLALQAFDVRGYGSAPVFCAPLFLRGDSDGDSILNITDPIRVLDFLFRGRSDLRCEDGADANDDGKVDIADPIFSLSFLFRGGPLPPPPGPLLCGADPTPEDRLGCALAHCP